MNQIKKLQNVFILLILVLLPGLCFAVSKENTSHYYRLVGYWYLVQHQYGIKGDIQSIVNLKADGTFEARLRVVRGEEVTYEQMETGNWDLKNNVQTMKTTHINGHHLAQDDYLLDSYDIDWISRKEMHYLHIGTGVEFKAKRVNKEFRFP